jgi:hypothetical protein
VHQHLGVGRRLEDRALAHQVAAHLARVGEVAVVREGERAAVVVHEPGLRVGQDGAAGGGVAGVADGEVATELMQHLRAEHVVDQAHAAVRPGLAVLLDRHHPGGLLPAVLQRVEAQVHELGRVPHAAHAEDPAHGR